MRSWRSSPPAARPEGGRVAAVLRLTRWDDDPEDVIGSPYSVEAGGRALDSVRGRPGRIARFINRGDTIGWPSATWVEDGYHWTAGGGGDVDELASLLEPLSLHGGEPSDPTDRFQVIGRRRHDPGDGEFVSRLTSLMITERGGPGELDLIISVRVEKRPPGLEGLPDAPVADGSRVIEVGGRTAIRTAPEVNDSRTALATTLADGSLLSIIWYEEGATYRELDGPGIRRIDEAVRQVAASVRRRTPADDDLSARLATEPEADDVLPLCAER